MSSVVFEVNCEFDFFYVCGEIIFVIYFVIVVCRVVFKDSGEFVCIV